MMLAAILAATLTWNVGGFSNEEVTATYNYKGRLYEWTTNTVTGKVHFRLKGEAPETPVDQWHKFARGDRVKFQKDTRPPQFNREEVEYKDRPPRKPQKKHTKKGDKK